MKKIKTVFEYDDNWQMSREVRPENQWVLDGEGVATLKWDGTACKLEGSVLYRRKTLKPDQYRRADDGQVLSRPEDWHPAQPEPRDNGKWPGWVVCSRDEPADQYHFEAFVGRDYTDGTYELVGPKVNGNPHNFDKHELIPHGESKPAVGFYRTYDGIRAYLKGCKYEGLVFHHKDGRMAKVRRSDFGFDWPVRD